MSSRRLVIAVLAVASLLACADYSPFDARRCRAGSTRGLVVDDPERELGSLYFGDEAVLDSTRPAFESLFIKPADLDGCGTLYGNVKATIANADLKALAGLQRVAADQEYKIQVSQFGWQMPLYGSVSITGANAGWEGATLHSNLTSLEGLEALESVESLTLGYAAAESLAPLAKLAHAGRCLQFDNMVIGSLDELTSLVSVDAVALKHLPNLTSLRKVAQLGKVSSLALSELDGLTDLSSLAGLQSVGALSISGNANLESLAGLEGVTLGSALGASGGSGGSSRSDYAYLELDDNDALTDLSALSGFTGTLNNLTLRDNDKLVDLSPLYNIGKILGILEIGGENMTCAQVKALVDAIGPDNIAEHELYQRVVLCGSKLDVSCFAGDQYHVTHTGQPCLQARLHHAECGN